MLRGGSRVAATSKMERFVIIVSGFQLLTVITKCSILDVAAALDPPPQRVNAREIVKKFPNTQQKKRTRKNKWENDRGNKLFK